MEAETAKEAEHADESATGGPVTEIKKRRGAYLPHWTREGGWYAVTFRLWDSLPHQTRA